jgi:predicted nucleic acid-binding protein
MHNIISNTSCLIALSNIDRLELLQKRYGRVFITPEVESEFGEILPDWISVVPVRDTYRTLLINSHLDLGESSTIALAGEIDDPLLILDDGKARKYAKSIGLKITGTLGIITKCYETGLIKDIAEVIIALRDVNFRIPNKFEEELFE